ncbi:dihydropteroate synthase [Nocardia sp. R7R-8]|uniref:dihydropteroate synthase n=1 Tax=Nocardia sp. R7R-8 TaxID=3459304 RepID=UPI00403DD6B5
MGPACCSCHSGAYAYRTHSSTDSSSRSARRSARSPTDRPRGPRRRETHIRTRGVIAARIEQRVDSIRLGDLSGGHWIGQPPVAGPASELPHPARHRHGNRFGDKIFNERIEAYEDVVTEVTEQLRTHAEDAVRRGVREVFVDPGLGFGKTTTHNLALLDLLETLIDTGFPVVGASRKSFIGDVLRISDPGERLAGSLAVAVTAVAKGAGRHPNPRCGTHTSGSPDGRSHPIARTRPHVIGGSGRTWRTP